MVRKHDKVDDRYVTGIWYDAQAGDFCKIQRGEDAVELVNPETNTVYHEIDYDDWYGEDFYPVPKDAIEDPAGYIEVWIADQMSRGTMDVGLMFADENTKIVETDDHSYIVE